MHIILEIILVNLRLCYYTLEAIVLFFVPSKRKNVKGQTVLVTGAGSGIGRLVAERFAKLGCKLVLWDIDGKNNDATASKLQEFGTTCYTYVCDISDKENVYRTAEKVKKDVGNVDILVNNAGIVTGKTILKSPDAMVEKTMAVNCLAHFWTVKSFLPSMLERNSGHIVTIASSAGMFGLNGLADYCASKFAAVGFDESLRMEIAAVKKTGVHTTCICPYFISTGMFAGCTVRFADAMPYLEPDYVADKIVTAVLTNQKLLMMPRSMYILFIMKSILPIKAMSVISEFMESSRYMDTFHGRKKQE